MASGQVNGIKRPNTWLHRPMLQNVKKLLPTRSRPHMTQQRQYAQRKSADRLTISYQRLMIHFAPTSICQTAAVATVSTMMAASKAIERGAPSSSR